ncbi:DMT family transporter [Rhizorhapis suberifaciens]|uniref:Small multidrug resistance pump n=1 Tax=Rhizorhapis suberifaciens TaxID=13656 RepID=A0A840HXQ9_9SPHN|nr:SMR family transporter [Rhizorhapis suberifaciens]MBB4642885.1 small multidrug resistance pump [Rhizorhapis suberifaciens]
MAHFYLAIAIIAEVTATSFLRQSEGFTKLVPTLITTGGYLIAFYCLSLTLRDLQTGVVYAIWSGVGIVLIAAVAWIFQGQKLDFPAITGIILIVAGIIVMSLFSKSTGH